MPLQLHETEVIKAPVISEKSTFQANEKNVYTFEVDKRADKTQIKNAVEKIFKVKVQSVRTARFHGKKRRQGRYAGRRPDWKKAYVTLKPGEKMIEFSEAQ